MKFHPLTKTYAFKVNFVPADGPVFGKAVTSHKELAAVNFTGSVP